jgi:hypothetical protein
MAGSTKAALVAEITALDEAQAAKMNSLRESALEIKTKYGLCGSGVDAFLRENGLPSYYTDDGRAHLEGEDAVWKPAEGEVNPEWYTEAGLRHILEGRQAGYEAQITKVRAAIFQEVRNGNIRSNSATEALEKAGMEPPQTTYSVLATSRTRWTYEPGVEVTQEGLEEALRAAIHSVAPEGTDFSRRDSVQVALTEIFA